MNILELSRRWNLARTLFALSVGGFGFYQALGQVQAGAPSRFEVGASRDRTGVVSGRVLNEGTGNYLANAVVRLEGTNRSAIAGPDGSFTLIAPAGNYELTTSYAGLDSTRQPITISSGETLSLEVVLTSKIYTLEKIVVQGMREENSIALQAQRAAPNPKTVVAVGAYGNPAVNPGELLQRLPGVSVEMIAGEPAQVYLRGLAPSFSQLMVDGEPVAVSFGNAANGRTFMMNQYATSNLSEIELIKAPTPDQDASGIGGFINFKTKRGFDRTNRQLRLSLGGIGSVRNFDRDNFQDRFKMGEMASVSYADALGVLGGKRNLGVALNYSRRDGQRLLEEMGPGIIGGNIANAYLNATSGNPLTRLFGTGDFTGSAVTDTFGVSLDYRINPMSSIYFRFGLTKHDNGPQRAYRNVVGNSAATAALFAPGSTYEFSTLLPSTASTALSRSFSGTKMNLTRNYSTGLNQKLFDQTVTLSLGGTYSVANSFNPDTAQIDAVARGIGFSIDRRGQDPWYPLLKQTAGPSIFDSGSYTIQSFQRQNPGLKTTRGGFTGDLKREFATRYPAYVKMGAKYVSDKRVISRSWEQFTFVGPDGVPATIDDLMSKYPHGLKFSTRLGYGPFPFLPIPDLDIGNALDPATKLDLPYGTSRGNLWAQTAADAYTSAANSRSVNSNVTEAIGAGYLMGNIDFGKFRLLSGVRFERTTVDAGAWVRNTTAAWGGNSVGGTSRDPAVVAANIARAERSFVRFRITTNSYQNVFPGLHVIYEPVIGVMLRASYNKSISRPPVASLLPTVTLDEVNRTATVGNPDLKPYTSDNFETGIERYFEPIGLVSAGVFQKEISNYFRQFQFTAGPEGIDGDPTFANYTINRASNIGTARIRGLEFNFQQRLENWIPLLRNFSLFANYTRTAAEGNFGSTATTNKLELLSPHSANAGISFQNRKLDIRVLGNYRGRQFAGNVSGIDFYRKDRVMVDVKLQYTISRRFQVYADLVNIFNTQTRADITANGLHWQMLNSGANFTIGVTLEL